MHMVWLMNYAVSATQATLAQTNSPRVLALALGALGSHWKPHDLEFLMVTYTRNEMPVYIDCTHMSPAVNTFDSIY